MKLRAAAAILIVYSTLVLQRAMPDLPERIPTSFNVHGQPTSTSRPETLWLLLAAQALIVALLLAVPYLARYRPEWVSLGRKRLSDFAPNSRGQVLLLIEGACGGLAVGFALFFSILIRQLVRAAMQPAEGPSFWLIPVFVLAQAAVFSYFAWKYIQLEKSLASRPSARGATKTNPPFPRDPARKT